MRHGFLLAAAAGFALAPPARAQAPDLPPVVVQSQSIGKWLDDIRAGAWMLGGDAAVTMFNDQLKAAAGEKGLDGLDLNRPVAVYVQTKPGGKLKEDTVAIGVIPVTGEKEAVALIERSKSKVEAVAGKPGLYKVTNLEKSTTSAVRFRDGHAYVSDAEDAVADAAKLLPVDKLVVPNERGLLAVRVYFERFPESARKDMARAIQDGLKSLENVPIPPDAKDALKQVTEELARLGKRYLTQAAEAEQTTVRLLFDTDNGEISVELGLTGKPGTSLAKDIAARTPTTNRFAGFLGPDAVGGVLLQLPLFAGELREAFAVAIESGAKEGLGDAPPPAKPVLEEVLKGMARTIRGGQFDLAVAATGPDKNGKYAAALGIAFDNPSAVEKELKNLLEQAPPPVKEMVKLDADKANGVAIHLVRPPLDGAPPQVKTLFGDTAAVALAFAPHGIYVTFGPDPVAAMKAALARPAAPARAMDIVVNPDRLAKMVAAVEPGAGRQIAEYFGGEAKPISAVFAAVEGGAELKLRLGVNLKLFPRAAAGFAVRGAAPPQ